MLGVLNSTHWGADVLSKNFINIVLEGLIKENGMELLDKEDIRLNNPELGFSGPAPYKTVIIRFKKHFAALAADKLTCEHAEEFIETLFKNGEN